ncbi:B-cell receptor CD22-like isoform X2 [Parambassis ranga]|uniref:B-cell receptor CD22 n=1 Tax=Parambassis ranga TaxID=210632 RepID=A0A6P7IWA6_9TELE|nr:B-cell receptor CD22-like isoform X2 [Parambassis ranga]
MALTAMTGFIFLLSMTVVQGYGDYGVTYRPTEICALEGSEVEIGCSYTYPSWIKSPSTTVKRKVWFTESGKKKQEPDDLTTDPQYRGRVTYTFLWRSCSMKITNLRKSDSAEYMFRFITNQPGGKYTGSPGVTLTVTALQVKVYGGTSYAYLRCESSCVLPHTSSYIWYKNEQILQKRNNVYLYPNHLNPLDSYICAVKGREDVPSPSVCVQGHSCNRVNYSKRSICAPRGSTVDISSTYSHHDQIQSKFWFRGYQWSHLQQDLKEVSQYEGRVEVLGPEIGRSTLTIRDLTERDSAEYKFKFKTQWSEWGSSLPGTTLTVTALQVQVSRIISDHPGYTEAELKCVSSCSPAGRLSFIWFRNEQRSMTQTSTYTDRFYPGDVVSCAFRGHENHRSPSLYAPKIPSVSVSPSAEIEEGQSLTLTCSSGANPAANYTWYKGDQTLVNKGPQLVFRSIQASISAEYYCTAETELGLRSSNYTSINVTYAPRLPFVSVSPSAEIEEGHSVTLTCRSDANPAANYTWYKGNQRVFEGLEGVHHFTSISSEDRGSYSCLSENKHGRKKSPSLFLDVWHPPKLPSVSVSPSADIVEGQSLTLTCSSNANPAANYTWYKEDEDSPKASGQNFTITETRAEHSGSYYCEAQNSRGRQNSSLHLITVKGSLSSAAAGSITALLLALIIILSAFLLIRRKRSMKHSSESRERPDSNRQHHVGSGSYSLSAEQQDEIVYSSVQFCKNQEDSLYSNITQAQHRLKEEEEDVEYSVVRFTNGTAAFHHDIEDPSGLYSTVCKNQKCVRTT